MKYFFTIIICFLLASCSINKDIALSDSPKNAQQEIQNNAEELSKKWYIKFASSATLSSPLLKSTINLKIPWECTKKEQYGANGINPDDIELGNLGPVACESKIYSEWESSRKMKLEMFEKKEYEKIINTFFIPQDSSQNTYRFCRIDENIISCIIIGPQSWDPNYESYVYKDGLLETYTYPVSSDEILRNSQEIALKENINYNNIDGTLSSEVQKFMESYWINELKNATFSN